MASNSRRSRRTGGFRDVNLTPLVDVMLVLLIVFMITAPLLTTALPVDVPDVSAEPMPIDDARLVVSVTADERIHFDDGDVTVDVEAVLANDEMLQAASAIYIRADQDAKYGVVARVVAAARAAGIGSVNLVVEVEEP